MVFLGAVSVLISLVLFLSCLLLSMFFTWRVRELAYARGWVSPPPSSRHIHKRPIPRLGGIAIFASFVISAFAVIVGLRLTGHGVPFDTRKLLYIIGPATLIFGVGLWDDIRALSAWWKFGAQIAAGVMLYLGGLKIIHIRSILGGHEFSWVTGLVATVLWVVWITNAFNLIDGMDGLASGSALLSTFVLFLNSLITRDPLTLFITAALAGAILGFLRFNFNPATIFLGDCGSLFIGFSLSALALAQTQKSPTLVAVCLPVVALGLPIMDTTLAVARRFISGKPLFSPDREHIHHKLLDQGLTHRQVVLILYAVSAAFGLVALFMRYPGGRVIGAVMIMVGAIVVLGVQRLGYIEFFELRRVAQRTLEQRQIIINNLALRRTRHELARSNRFDETCSALKKGFSENAFDGFELSVSGAFAKGSVHPFELRGSESVFSWAKQSVAPSACWRLTLELTTSKGRAVGALSVFRRYGDQSLMLDINLLTHEFATVLADAIERASASARKQSMSSPVLVGASSSAALGTQQH
jgi:UDP-GlcNAc:undecaprenyl-phosphate/decaprenyl-phosphate GlcNAc-1-phosphate transferase